jgi:hypothetical protein
MKQKSFNNRNIQRSSFNNWGSVTFTVFTTGTVDTSMVREEPVRVGLRLRPLNKLEASRRSRCCINVKEGLTDFTVDSPLDGEYDFHYDKVTIANSFLMGFLF